VLADGSGVESVLARSREMQRARKQAAAHDSAPLERPRQVLPAEALDPRPEVDVGRLDALRVQRADALERPRDRQPRPLEQQLAREQRAIQLPDGQHPLGHGRTAAFR
jgi:hypothetical protein